MITMQMLRDFAAMAANRNIRVELTVDSFKMTMRDGSRELTRDVSLLAISAVSYPTWILQAEMDVMTAEFNK